MQVIGLIGKQYQQAQMHPNKMVIVGSTEEEQAVFVRSSANNHSLNTQPFRRPFVYSYTHDSALAISNLIPQTFVIKA